MIIPAFRPIPTTCNTRPGAPALAAEVLDLLAHAGMPGEADTGRGLDHGVFIPFMLAFAQADIPVVELSLPRDLNAAHTLHMGLPCRRCGRAIS